MSVDEQLFHIRENLHQIQGHAFAYQMLCQALIATHPDRQRLRARFDVLSKFVDETVGHLPDPDRLRRYFDQAHNQIVAALQAGAAEGS